MKSLTVTLPRPPSANNLFRNAPGKGRVKTPVYQAWIQRAGLMLNQQTAEAGCIEGPISLRIVVHKGRADLANLEKGITDLLVSHRLIGDDRNVVEIYMRHSETMGENCRVTVERDDRAESLRVEQGRAA